jgi:hypothetical protein
MSIFNNSCLPLSTEDNYILSPKGFRVNNKLANKEKLRQPNKLMTVLAIPHPA